LDPTTGSSFVPAPIDEQSHASSSSIPPTPYTPELHLISMDFEQMAQCAVFKEGERINLTCELP